jgi:hypothetical protein
MPSTDAAGVQWDDSWTSFGTKFGVDIPEEYVFLNSSDSQSLSGIYYAGWGAGELLSEEDGEDAVYEAQLGIIIKQCGSASSAEVKYYDWLADAREKNTIDEETTITCNDVTYTVLYYSCETTEDFPYSHGVSAFGVCGPNAVCAELTATDSFDEDLLAKLTDVLENCHYSD